MTNLLSTLTSYVGFCPEYSVTQKNARGAKKVLAKKDLEIKSKN